MVWVGLASLSVCFFFNDTATTEIYTLSLHDALPISVHVTVDDRDVSDVKLEHSGYMMTVQSTHSLKLVIIKYPVLSLSYAYIPKYHLTVASAAARMNGSCVLL